MAFKFCAIKPDAIIQVASYKYVVSLSNFNQIDYPTVTVIDLKKRKLIWVNTCTVAAFKHCFRIMNCRGGGGLCFWKKIL